MQGGPPFTISFLFHWLLFRNKFMFVVVLWKPLPAYYCFTVVLVATLPLYYLLLYILQRAILLLPALLRIYYCTGC